MLYALLFFCVILVRVLSIRFVSLYARAEPKLLVFEKVHLVNWNAHLFLYGHYISKRVIISSIYHHERRSYDQAPVEDQDRICQAVCRLRIFACPVLSAYIYLPRYRTRN